MKLVSNEPFISSRNGFRQLSVVVNGGTATLEALAGGKAGTPIAVPDGAVTADSFITFYAISDQWFRVTLTGNADAWLTG